MVVFAHSLATVQNADVIFVFGEGKLLEQGTHIDLLKSRSVYWQMVSAGFGCSHLGRYDLY
jgi:ABC-type multidrug transport system fused ATPase/permease subunit